MQILIRAIITGFGLKLGQDIYRVVNDKLGIFPEEGGSKRDEDDEDGELDEAPVITFYLHE
ncbi:MAG: hypothetical protein KC486_18320 [Myxococcales bacterium]|nr:hypothetical protein [Myxococcales bacterium]